MLMVIFGAGASYDSAQAFRVAAPHAAQQSWAYVPPPPEEPWRPPLANELFLDRHNNFGPIIKNYPKLTHILSSLRERVGGKSVEEVLEALLVESEGNPETKRELASVRFYLCHLLNEITDKWHSQTNGVTNYASLLREILIFNKLSEPVCLVTFNYDLLLEHALYTFDFKGREPKDQLDSHPILKLFKLHGSVGWARIVDAPSGTRLTPQGLIETADTLNLTDDFVRANPSDPRQFHNFGRPIFPAIAIPVQTKSDQYFECPRTHLNSLQEMLQHITKILIIGWQAKEAHFLGMLRSRLPKLGHVMVVGANPSDAEGTLKYFLVEIRLDLPYKYVGQGGFTDFIVNQEGYGFFKA